MTTNFSLEDIGRLRTEGKREQALECLRALSGESELRVPWKAVQIANELLALEEYDEAERIYDLALERKPDHLGAIRGKARILRHRGLVEQSLLLTLKLIEAQPDNLQCRMDAARDLEALGRHEEAARQLDGVLAAEPGHQAAVSRKARIAKRYGHPKPALAVRSEAARCSPEKADCRVRLAVLRRDQGAEVWALQEFAGIAGTYPDEEEPKMQAGFTARSLGLREAALEWFNRAAALSAGNYQPHAEAVTELIYLGRWNEAEKRLDGVQVDSKDARNFDWLRVQLMAHRGDSGAKRAFSTLLESARNTRQALKFIRQGRQFGFFMESLSWLEQLEPGCPPMERTQVVMARSRILLDAGMRRSAREAMSRLPETELNAAQSIECAEVALDACCISRARTLLRRGTELMLSGGEACKSPERELALRVCHDFGEQALRDRLFEEGQSSGAWQSAPNATKQAMRLCADGRLEEARGLVEREALANTDLPIGRWRGRLSSQSGDYRQATEAFAGLVAGPVVSLQDARSRIQSLLDAEQVDQAERELERLGPHFAVRDLALLRFRILNLNLYFEEAIECLQKELHIDPLNEAAAVCLAKALIDNAEFEAASGLIDQWLDKKPNSGAWMNLRLDWAGYVYKDWAQWFEWYDRFRLRTGYRHRLHLMQKRIIAMMHVRQHNQAERLLARFARLLPSLPLAYHVRAGFEIQCASRWSLLGRYDRCRSILGGIHARGLPGSLRDSFYHVSATCEVYGSRDAKRVASEQNQVRNVRHHLKFTDFSPAGADHANALPPLRVAVLLHLYYRDLWQEIHPYLLTLRGTKFRLFVTVRQEELENSLLHELKALDPMVRVLPVENRGFDVGAHWQALDTINLDEFDLALLLQTKKNNWTRIGSVWRENLLNALIGTRERWQENLEAFHNNPGIGMLGSGLHRNSWDLWDYGEMRRVLEAVGMPTRYDVLQPCYEQVVGTMFLIRADLLSEIFRKTRDHIVFEHYDTLSLHKRTDRTYAHAMERALGMYVRWRGYEILWRP